MSITLKIKYIIKSKFVKVKENYFRHVHEVFDQFQKLIEDVSLTKGYDDV